jgi:hypothetical protein
MICNNGIAEIKIFIVENWNHFLRDLDLRPVKMSNVAIVGIDCWEMIASKIITESDDKNF